MFNSNNRYSKSEFECGNYSFSAFYLSYYRLLDVNSATSFSALWGKLASEILMKMWDQALEDIKTLQQIIDEREESHVRVPNHLEQLQLRSWLMHWSLFVFFQHPNGVNEIVEFFTQEKYLNAIQTNCPWLLRYLTAAVIVNKRRGGGSGGGMKMQDLIVTLQQERYTYRDPITMFVEALYVDFDFEQAQQKLMDCEKLLAQDFFLAGCLDEVSCFVNVVCVYAYIYVWMYACMFVFHICIL
jgi:translation initiation factor 3 subunit E